MVIPYVFKKCTKCGDWLVANRINFYKSKKGKYGLASKCKKCDKYYRDKHKDERRGYHECYRKEHKEKIAKYNKQYRDDNKERIKLQRKKYREKHKEEISVKQKKHYDKNKKHYLEYKKQWYKENKEQHLEKVKLYREKHKEEITRQRKQYLLTPQGRAIIFNASTKRRLREKNQGNGINGEQWLEMMNFFDWRCAYSGEYIGGSSKYRTVDHVVALNKGGEHEIWNCVPMHRTYNSSKRNQNMEEWYENQSYYSEERLNKIYEWQEYAYAKYNELEALILKIKAYDSYDKTNV